MARSVWINPNPPGGFIRAIRGGLSQDVIFVDDSLEPPISPAPAGNAFVPAGWVRQIGDDGECDTMLGDIRSGSLVYDANITQWAQPYFTGGWPPDPQAGQPGHTAQRPTGAG